MELLERDGALAALGEAHGAAARGEGRVVFVTGEPLAPELRGKPRARAR